MPVRNRVPRKRNVNGITSIKEGAVLTTTSRGKQCKKDCAQTILTHSVEVSPERGFWDYKDKKKKD